MNDSQIDPELVERSSLLPESATVTGDAQAKSVWFLAGPLLPDMPLRHLSITGTPFVVGRRPGLHYTIARDTVSSAHAEIHTQDDHLIICDLKSTNGTYICAQRIVGQGVARAGDIVQFADVPFRVLRQSASSNNATICHDVVDQALALVQFEKLLNEQAVVPYFQPLVNMSDGATLAYEVLGRSRFPGLETPAAMFSVAAQLDLEVQLSQLMRMKGVQESFAWHTPPHLFVNTHPAELKNPGLIESIESLRQLAPAQRITLEIHESAVAQPAELESLQMLLKPLDIGLAFDDFGAGQARLLELFAIQPDCVKFDMSLIRHIHRASANHREMVGSLVAMVKKMGIIALAEGVELAEEADMCRQLGFEMAQGYYFGRPAPVIAYQSNTDNTAFVPLK